LFCFDAEGIHDFIVSAGKAIQSLAPFGYLARKACRVSDSGLKTQVFNLSFDNPVGLAAGFDKNAELIDFFYDLGFGFLEVGSLSAIQSKGNAKPRISRLVKEEAVINNMGLPNAGIDVALPMLYAKRAYPVGVNIAQSPNARALELPADELVEDVAYAFRKAALAADYIALNISCPNLRAGKPFEDPNALDALLKRLKMINSKVPLLVKLSPDMQQQALEEIILACSARSVDGYVISNTKSLLQKDVTKGLSGAPIQSMSTGMIKRVYELTDGKVPLIGVGGINSAVAAYEKIKAGASLVQLYTGLVYQGPLVAKMINKGLIRLLENDRFSSISGAVGKNA
jgi:dihydroorotate dehydrogenase